MEGAMEKELSGESLQQAAADSVASGEHIRARVRELGAFKKC